MISCDSSSGICFYLKNIAYLRFSELEEYPDVISPYSRMYLITRGNGHVVIGDETIKLEPDYLYLFPSFVHCSYSFYPELEHIYIHFRTKMENGLSIYNLFSFKNKIPATSLTKTLFYRLLELNPKLELPHHDPQIYQSKLWMDKKPSFHTPGHKLESEAILQHLFSGFITKTSGIDRLTFLKYNFRIILHFIHENLHNDIKIDQLAKIACLSKDHFTRIFKSVLGMPPCEFIIRKRIEKAQFLLLSTNASIHKIIDETNFKNAPYFSRMFKKYTGYTPAEYQKLRQSSI